VQLLTIGAFARAARLSAKALRLYDELGLLPPAAVDGESGYRYYHPAQLERARLIAWLRRIGMPLARIRLVLDLAPAAAAKEVSGYWAEVTAETSGRAQLASFLVDYLSGRGTTMTQAVGTLGVRFAARTDPGTQRDTNEDVAYAGSRLLAVADGVRAAGGDRASAAAVDALKPLDGREIPAGELLNAMAEAIGEAERAVAEVARAMPSGEAVTTLTALLWSGSELGLVHIGDCRAYLFRGTELFQVTHDHSYVQSLVDEGRLSPEEARSHPQRALLVRALTGTGGHRPDISLHTAVAGDRYLLCSDGLSTVVADETLRAALAEQESPQSTVDRLVGLARERGAPDNIACAVADVIQL
jgi:PPM family protein phosphatase